MLKRLGIPILLAAALAVAAPTVTARASDSSGSETVDTRFGVLMAVSCGATARVATQYPNPVTIIIAAVACTAMMIDALITSDTP